MISHNCSVIIPGILMPACNIHCFLFCIDGVYTQIGRNLPQRFQILQSFDIYFYDNLIILVTLLSLQLKERCY